MTDAERHAQLYRMVLLAEAEGQMRSIWMIYNSEMVTLTGHKKPMQPAE